LSVHIKNGRITKISTGDFPIPFFRGACAKGLLAHHWTYHPDRLQYPMKRIGPRGSGKWERISWEDAISGISEKLGEIAKTYGPGAVAWSAPELPYLSLGGFSRLVTLTQGTWIQNWGYGDIAGPCADISTFGYVLGGFYMTVFAGAKQLIVWGWNPAETNPLGMKAIRAAKKDGAEVIVIDPRYTKTAAAADRHISIRPGTDGALALGMLHVIVNKGLIDEDFITQHTVGPFLVRTDNGLFLRKLDLSGNPSDTAAMVWDEIGSCPQPFDMIGIKPALRGRYAPAGIECRPASDLLFEMVKNYSPERVADITDIPAAVIERLATDYATLKPVSIQRGFGLQRSFHSDLSWRAINTLAAFTGNISFNRLATVFETDTSSLYFPEPSGTYNRLPIMHLYSAITEGRPYPVKALCFSMHNFINQMPNARKIVDELLPKLELILVCDLFLSSTAKYADYVLPAASFLECLDLVPQMGKPYVQLQQKVINPPDECRSNFQIAAALGREMGFAGHFEKSEEEYIEEILNTCPAYQGITLEDLQKGPVEVKPSEGPAFKTPSGRIEFYVEKLKPFGQELPVYLEPVESLRQQKAEKDDLSLLTPHAKYRLHSTFTNVPELLKFDPEPLLSIHPADARNRDIKDRDPVYVSNDRGKIKLRASVTPDIKPGVVSITQGWCPEHFMEGHYQELTHDRLNPAQDAILGSNAAYFDVRVKVTKA
jgi:anaerobic dimethyl sulfoxide reductase subunit A